MNFAKHFIGGILNVVSNIDPAIFIPSAPPPPRRPLAFEEAHENDEEKAFRRAFKKLAGEVSATLVPKPTRGSLSLKAAHLEPWSIFFSFFAHSPSTSILQRAGGRWVGFRARPCLPTSVGPARPTRSSAFSRLARMWPGGAKPTAFVCRTVKCMRGAKMSICVCVQDMEVSPKELMNILNQVLTKHQALKTDGFSIESCRSMVAVMDSDSTGKLGFHEFKHMWKNIKKWQKIYEAHDKDGSGVICARELGPSFQDAGFPLKDELYKMIIRRYSDEHGDMDFDNFVGCLVRLDAMCNAFKTLDKGNSGSISLDIQEWLQLTMYS
ncbi:calpain small subunit 1-like isoform X1 [Stigmatopora argus]